MKEAAASLRLPMAATPLVLRQVYADAPGQSAVVRMLGSRASEAAHEVDKLFREILPDACRKKGLRATIGRKITAA
jgi:chromosome partitioning protein